jgi:hypothetical protein
VKAHNPNCDGSHCLETAGEVRVMPYGGDGHLILCHACYRVEMAFRRERNLELLHYCHFDLPSWDSLKVYSPQ